MSLRIRPSVVVLSALALLGIARTPLSAQTIGIHLSDSTRITVAPSAKVTVPILIDLTNATGGLNIASLQTDLTWGATRLTFDSLRVVGASGFSLTSNLGNAASGSISFNGFSATALTAGAIANAYFTASATTGGTRISATPVAAGNELGASILAQLRARALDVCVAPSGKWGDANGDGTVNIIDAQQIARASVGLSTANPTAVAERGDVTADGNVNILDAQQIARFSVGLSAAARVNTNLFTPPPVASVVINSVIDISSGAAPNTPINTSAMAVGKTAQINAEPRDAGSASLLGCAAITYSSSVPGVATVSSSGVITAVSAGSTVITVTSGGQNATINLTVAGGGGGSVASLQLVDGGDLAGYNGVQTGAPVRVRALNAGGGAVPGATVTISLTGGLGLIGPVGSTRASGSSNAPLNVITDSDGVANFLLWTSEAAGGTTTFSAAATGATTRTMTVASLVIRLGAHMCKGDVRSLRCWGDGSRGQLGNGTNSNSTTPVTVNSSGIALGATSWIAQEAFGDHSCLLDDNGAAYCWGSNSAGQLGDSTYVNRNVPTAVKGGLLFRDIVVGSEHSCGLTKTGGEIWCWGYNWAGQLGDSTFSNRRSYPQKVKAPGVVFTALTAGTNHSCGGTASGTWYCWGLNAAGQLGDGTTFNRSIPTTVTAGASFVQIDGGESHSCGRDAAGVTSCWGSQTNGALGNGQTNFAAVTAPYTIPGHNFTYLYAGLNRTCAIKADFTTWCWGQNNVGQLGDNSLSVRPTPTVTAFTGYALLMGGTNAGSSPQRTCGLSNVSQQLHCWGSNAQGLLGTGGAATNELVPRLVAQPLAPASAPASIVPLDPVPTASVPVGFVSGTDGLSVLLRDGQGTPLSARTITWDVLSGAATFAGGVSTITSQTNASGQAYSGVIAAGGTPGIITVRASTPGNFPDGTAGLIRHVFVIYVTPAIGSAQKISGDNIFVGGINLTTVDVPITVRIVDGGGNGIVNAGVNFRVGANSGSFAVGTSEIAVLTDANGYASILPGSWLINPSAGAVSTLIAEGEGFTLTFTATAGAGGVNNPLTSCERATSGTVYCWGIGAAGQIGNGANTQVNTPTAVSGGLNFTQLATGVAPYKCGLVGTAAYCWGLNDAGQLGDGTRVNRNVPTAVTGGVAFTALATGTHTTCGINTAGALYCWGWSLNSGFGLTTAERGRSFTAPMLVPTPVAAIAQVTIGEDQLCIRSAAGQLWCRGNSLRGWNLDGTTTDRSSWNEVSGNWVDVSAAYLGICAVNAAGEVWCAGRDQNLGFLGNGLMNNFTQLTMAKVNTTGLGNFTKVFNYHFGACGMRADARVWCWGSNAFGQTGTGITGLVLSPNEIVGMQFASIRPQAFRTVCGIQQTSNQLYCWGQNGNGQLGLGSTDGNVNAVPRLVGSWTDGPAAGTASAMLPNGPTSLSVVVSASAPTLPSVVVRDRTGAPIAGVNVSFTLVSGTGTLTGTTIATNASGIATLGSFTAGATPAAVSRINATATGLPGVTFFITAVEGAASAVANTNTTQYSAEWETSNRNGLQVLVRNASNQPIASYPVTYTIASGGGTIGGSTSTTVLTNASGVSSIFSWNTPTTYPGGTYTVTATAQGLAPVTFTMIKIPFYSGRNNCRLTAAGAAYCWGEPGPSPGSAIGDGTSAIRQVPTAVSGGLTFTSLAIGARSQHNCGLTAAGVAYCWGMNLAGELGDGTQTSRSTPVAVAGGHTFTKLFKGIGGTCGIKSGTNQLLCWGWTGSSRLGDGVIGDVRLTPTVVNTNGLTFTSVALALEGTCGITASNGVHCWSATNGAMVGDNAGTRSLPPLGAITGLTATQIEGGDRNFCAAATDGAIRCWGENSLGQLGNGTTSSSNTPVAPTGLSNVAEVRFTSWTTVCARTNAGEMFCWGQNTVGQIGDGSTVSRLTPTRVGEGLNFGAFNAAASDGQTCARTTAGTQYCWGINPVGDNTVSPRSYPTLVLWPEGTVGTAAAMTENSSLTLSAASGVAVSPAPSVKVVNFDGTPLAGVTVTFAQGTGTGTVTGGTAVTNASGIATVGSWALTSGSGTSGTLRATVPGLRTIVFTSTVP